MADINERSKICFSVLPLSSELRDYSEQVFEFIIVEAAEQFGYQSVRSDQIGDTAIAPQVIKHLAQDSLVIADLTGQSPQVFYGLAIRHASRKPIIHVIREGEPVLPEFPDIPFLHINVSSARDAKRCKQELITRMALIEQNNDPQDTPVSRALKRQILEQSESLLDQRAAEMLKRLGSIGHSVNNLEERLSQPENIIPPELVKLLESVHNIAASIDERLSQPEIIFPSDHLLHVVKNSGLLLDREAVDQMMSEIIAYAEDAKNVLTAVNPQLSKTLRGLNNVTGTLNKPVDLANPIDLAGLSTQVS